MICLSDSNIWIDREWAQLIVEAFSLDLRWAIPDIVLAEMKTVNRERILNLGIEVCTLSGEQVEQVAQLAARFRRPSEADLACLVLARDQSALLVTGDQALRQAAENEGIDVHGILWLLDLMIDRQIVTTVRAADGLETILRSGAHLPAQEVHSRLNTWRRL